MALAAPLMQRIQRTRGKKPLWHLLYLVGVVVVLVLIPGFIQDEIFSPGGVLVLGTLWPVYASIRAICSIGEEDDTAWLQFWIASASLSFSTEFMDNITKYLPAAGEHWYEFEFFFNLWLILPMTDGAALIYDKVRADAACCQARDDSVPASEVTHLFFDSSSPSAILAPLLKLLRINVKAGWEF